MEINPFPVRSKYMNNPKPIKKPSDAPNLNPKPKSSLLREKRVFGTARNPNIPTKTAPANSATAVLKKPGKPSHQATRSPPSAAKNLSEENQPRPKKKSVCFQESDKALCNEPQTPVNLPDAPPKPRRVSTPYYTADKCSKCRFDKLETSAYWLSQIKLAESVGKHSVSAAFFGLAMDCKAEPIRNIRVELKKYMARHDCLYEEEQWRQLSVGFGLSKEEFSTNAGNIETSVEENEK